ncbi:MAG: ATP-dependent Clp protease adaptor ClpS [Rhodovibrio sp.]|nr:ATP-dependent Clp protease adaptor ClpS [Rhodovibrio sp.]
MSEDVATPKTEHQHQDRAAADVQGAAAQRRLYPREFVVAVLMSVFGMNKSKAYSVMMTAHQQGERPGRRLRQGHRRDQGPGSLRHGPPGRPSPRCFPPSRKSRARAAAEAPRRHVSQPPWTGLT